MEAKMTRRLAIGTAFALGLGCGVPLGHAASHREAPLVSEDPAADSTDLYLFRTPAAATDVGIVPSSVVIIANYWPLEEPGGGPNWPRFSDSVLYEIKIDNDGDAKEDITYQFRFRTEYVNPGSFLYASGPVASASATTLQVRQRYTVSRMDGTGPPSILLQDQLTPPVYTGTFTMGSTAAYQALADTTVYALGGSATTNGRVFAGQRDDPFFADLGGIFDLVRIRCAAAGGNTPNTAAGCATSGVVKGVDYLAGYNVHSLALQVPIGKLLKANASPSGKDQIIGVWTTASRPRVTIRRSPTLAAATQVKTQDSAGPWVQVSRLGLPLMNEVLIPVAYKDYYSGTAPVADSAFFKSPAGVTALTSPELATALGSLYAIPVPAAGRSDLQQLMQFHLSKNADGSSPIPPFLGIPYGLAAADILRLDLSTAPPADFVSNPLGAISGIADSSIGFPNGRRLQDDVVDITEKLVGGALRGLAPGLVSLITDGVAKNDRPFLLTFPYLGTPWSGSEVNTTLAPFPYLHTAQ